MSSNLNIIISREYTERVRRKSFIITTILMPVLMLVCMALPGVIMVLAGNEEKEIAVVDQSNVVAKALQSDDDVHFTIVNDNTTIDSLKKSEVYDAVLVIGRDVVKDPTQVTLFTKGSPSIQTEGFIRQQIGDAIHRQRIKSYDIPNLDDILADLDVEVSMTTYRTDREQEETTSSILSYILGVLMDMMLYMFILLYGQMVMTSIIEEKNNRVLEIIVTSVKPTTLMTGKVLGVGLVAATQILIWGLILVCTSRWLMPLFSTGIGADPDADMVAVLSQLSDVKYIAHLMFFAFMFMIAGFIFYSSIFAAIGSAVDNVQDASQLTTIAVVPIMLGMIFSMAIANDPNSALAFWVSIIPFTSPMAMMARIPFGIPDWEIWLSLVILVISALAMLWASGKVYRVGIFMYGKKPSLIEISKWISYK